MNPLRAGGNPPAPVQLPGAELGQQGSEPGSQELSSSYGVSSCSQGVHSYIPPTGVQGLAPAAAPPDQLLGLG